MKITTMKSTSERMSIDEKFYVYAHLDETGAAVYLGSGCEGRAWECNKSRRHNKEHRQWMEQRLPELDVQIIASRVTRKEAMALEAVLVRKLEPKFNIHNTSRMDTTASTKAMIKTLSIKHECVHCGLQANAGLIKRWHNDNCKRRKH